MSGGGRGADSLAYALDSGLNERMMQLVEVGLQSSALFHDLNNLLQVVVGNLDLVADASLDDRTAASLARARTGVDRCVTLARRTLACGRWEGEAGRLSVTAFLAGMAEHLRALCGPGIMLEIAADAEDLVIKADEIELENALLNLVINARDAMGGRGRLRIACGAGLGPELACEKHSAPERVVLQVEDTGPGIPHALQHAILERFVTTKPAGTGLGLANVRAFVEAAGGSLAIDSAPGLGTRVSLSFPRLSAPACLSG